MLYMILHDSPALSSRGRRLKLVFSLDILSLKLKAWKALTQRTRFFSGRSLEEIRGSRIYKDILEAFLYSQKRLQLLSFPDLTESFLICFVRKRYLGFLLKKKKSQNIAGLISSSSWFSDTPTYTFPLQ